MWLREAMTKVMMEATVKVKATRKTNVNTEKQRSEHGCGSAGLGGCRTVEKHTENERVKRGRSCLALTKARHGDLIGNAESSMIQVFYK